MPHSARPWRPPHCSPELTIWPLKFAATARGPAFPAPILPQPHSPGLQQGRKSRIICRYEGLGAHSSTTVSLAPSSRWAPGLAPSSNMQGSHSKHVKGWPARSRGREEMTLCAKRMLSKGCPGCSGFLEHTTFVCRGEIGPMDEVNYNQINWSTAL